MTERILRRETWCSPLSPEQIERLLDMKTGPKGDWFDRWFGGWMDVCSPAPHDAHDFTGWVSREGFRLRRLRWGAPDDVILYGTLLREGEGTRVELAWAIPEPRMIVSILGYAGAAVFGGVIWLSAGPSGIIALVLLSLLIHPLAMAWSMQSARRPLKRLLMLHRQR